MDLLASDGRPRAGTGVSGSGLYGAGQEDVVVTNLPTEGFTFYQGQPGGNFMDVTAQSGMLRTSLAHTGFGVAWIDLENRGLLDLFSANGAVAAQLTQQGDPYPYHERNLLLRNLGKGKGFDDITASAGAVFERVGVGRAAVFGDVNNDGGMDILVTNNNGQASATCAATPPVSQPTITVSFSGWGSRRTWSAFRSADPPGPRIVEPGLNDRIMHLREGSGQPCPANH